MFFFSIYFMLKFESCVWFTCYNAN